MIGWTEEEKTGFIEWDRARKAGELGVPIKFNNATKLRVWLESKYE